MPRVLPVLGLIAQAIGETLSYAFGAGNARWHRFNFELKRYKYIIEQDRKAITGWNGLFIKE